MGIEHVNPYNHRPIGLSKKATAGSKLLEAKELVPDKRSMEKWMSKQEKLKNTADQMKSEQAKMKQLEERMKAEQDEMKILMTCLEISR